MRDYLNVTLVMVHSYLYAPETILVDKATARLAVHNLFNRYHVVANICFSA